MIKIKKVGNINEINDRLTELLPRRRHKPNEAPVCLVVDAMNLVYAAYYAYQKLSFKGNSTAIIFGLPQMIKSVMQRYRTDRIIVCWDGLRHPRRVELLPEYKGHRDSKRDPEERKKFLLEVKKVRKLLYRMGVAQAYDPSVEGDDMIYFITNKMVKTHRVIIVSGDKDFHQLINYDVNVYNPRTNEPITSFAFKGTYPVELPQFVDYLCLTGDKSDDIPGYRGIGPQRAGKFFEKFYYVSYYLESKAEFSGLGDKEELRRIYERNREMIDLAYFCKKNYPKDYDPKFYKNKTFPKFNDERYRAICIKWNLKTMLNVQFMAPFKKL